MKIDIKILVPIAVVMLGGHFSVMGWLAVVAYEASYERAEIKALVGSAISRMNENSDDIDEIRRHTHPNMGLAMADIDAESGE